MANGSYRDLDAWRTGIELTTQVYELTHTFPDREQQSLGTLLQQAAVAIPANIAESHIRSSVFHLSVARGSLAEVETMLTIAEKLQFCPTASAAVLMELCDHVNTKMTGLQRKLNERGTQS